MIPSTNVYKIVFRIDYNFTFCFAGYKWDINNCKFGIYATPSFMFLQSSSVVDL